MNIKTYLQGKFQLMKFREGIQDHNFTSWTSGYILYASLGLTVNVVFSAECTIVMVRWDRLLTH